mgnify:CR=1 FL=1
MRDATMRATRDYSPHKVAESVQGGEGQFLELWRLLLKALSWSIVLAVSAWISYKIHQRPDMSKNIVRAPVHWQIVPVQENAMKMGRSVRGRAYPKVPKQADPIQVDQPGVEEDWPLTPAKR